MGKIFVNFFLTETLEVIKNLIENNLIIAGNLLKESLNRKLQSHEIVWLYTDEKKI